MNTKTGLILSLILFTFISPIIYADVFLQRVLTSTELNWFFILALVITLILELIVGLIFVKYIRLKEQNKILFAIFLANLISFPIVWFVFPLIKMDSLLLIIFVELFAILFEGIFMHYSLNKEFSLKNALILSSIMNFVSFFLGSTILILFISMSFAMPITPYDIESLIYNHEIREYEYVGPLIQTYYDINVTNVWNTSEGYLGLSLTASTDITSFNNIDKLGEFIDIYVDDRPRQKLPYGVDSCNLDEVLLPNKTCNLILMNFPEGTPIIYKSGTAIKVSTQKGTVYHRNIP